MGIAVAPQFTDDLRMIRISVSLLRMKAQKKCQAMHKNVRMCVAIMYIKNYNQLASVELILASPK